MDNEKIYISKKDLLKFLNIKDNFLYPKFSTKYSTLELPKKNGGFRTIKPPHYNLKKIQRKILDDILYKHKQLNCVYGLSKEKGIRGNAIEHSKNVNLQLVILDIENFFPTISYKDVIKIFKKIGFSKENSNVLKKLCTIDDSLPQGAPTSPYLASMVCFNLDKEIYIYCKRRSFVYTRYFDDISISGKNILPIHIKQIENIIKKYGFKCNESKRKIFDCNSDKIIDSVLIKNSGLSVTDSYKNEIVDYYRILINDDNLQNKKAFSGKFGFYLHINKKEAILFLQKLKIDHLRIPDIH